MRRAAIVCPLRTAVGGFGGALKNVAAHDMAATIVNAVVQRSGIAAERIDDVIMAQGYANGEAPAIGRVAALVAGLPIEVPGMQLDRRCGSGLQAVINAAMMVQTGAADVVLAAGVESMSQVEYYSTDMRWGARSGAVTMHDRLTRSREMSQPEARFGRISGMIETAENLARDYNITREECDRYAVSSHQRAASARDRVLFDDEIVPLTIPSRKGEPQIFSADEGIRADVSVESLAKLKPIIKGGVVTAGNASQQNDAASACLVVAEDKLAALGLTPIGFMVGWAVAGCDPSRMGIGPVPAVGKLLAKTGLSLEQMDLVELNEAFACQVLAVLKGLQWHDESRLNVNGSGISLGHPIGATGVRILTTMMRELERRNARYGLETMCIGGGQGIAAIFERP